MPVVSEESPPPQRRRGRYPKRFHKDASALVISTNTKASQTSPVSSGCSSTRSETGSARNASTGESAKARRGGPRGERQASPGAKDLTMERDLLKEVWPS
jgi:hypothetical protein